MEVETADAILENGRVEHIDGHVALGTDLFEFDLAPDFFEVALLVEHRQFVLALVLLVKVFDDLRDKTKKAPE